MAQAGNGEPSLAVLIDADNAAAATVEPLLGEVAKLGVASVKRIYGNWTRPHLGQWKDVLLEHSIQPVQQFAYTTGKNATDSALIIDAMDLLYTGRFGGFCLVSSDSDFTRLAARIRESGVQVYGFGEHKTPRAFVAACDRFTYTGVFSVAATAAAPAAAATPPPGRALRGDTRLVNLLRSAIDAASDDSGWAHLGALGSLVGKRANDFDTRSYGFAKLGALVEATGLFEVERRDKVVYVRNRRVRDGS